MQGAAKLEVRSASGNLLFVVIVTETEITPAQTSQVKSNGSNGQSHSNEGLKLIPKKDETKPQPASKATPTNGESPMSDSQKRLLFRLLADQGMENEKAHEHLKEKFQVNSLKEVTKSEASREIEKLIDSAKGGRPSHASA